MGCVFDGFFPLDEQQRCRDILCTMFILSDLWSWSPLCFLCFSILSQGQGACGFQRWSLKILIRNDVNSWFDPLSNQHGPGSQIIICYVLWTEKEIFKCTGVGSTPLKLSSAQGPFRFECLALVSTMNLKASDMLPPHLLFQHAFLISKLPSSASPVPKPPKCTAFMY